MIFKWTTAKALVASCSVALSGGSEGFAQLAFAAEPKDGAVVHKGPIDPALADQNFAGQDFAGRDFKDQDLHVKRSLIEQRPLLVPRSPAFLLSVTVPAQESGERVSDTTDSNTTVNIPSSQATITWVDSAGTTGTVAIPSLDQYARGFSRRASAAERNATAEAWDCDEHQQQLAGRWLIDFLLNYRLSGILSLLPEGTSITISISNSCLFDDADIRSSDESMTIRDLWSERIGSISERTRRPSIEYIGEAALWSPTLEFSESPQLERSPSKSQLVLKVALAAEGEIPDERLLVIEQRLNTELSATRAFVKELNFAQSGAGGEDPRQRELRILQVMNALFPQPEIDPRTGAVNPSPTGRPLYPALPEQMRRVARWHGESDPAQSKQVGLVPLK